MLSIKSRRKIKLWKVLQVNRKATITVVAAATLQMLMRTTISVIPLLQPRQAADLILNNHHRNNQHTSITHNHMALIMQVDYLRIVLLVELLLLIKMTVLAYPPAKCLTNSKMISITNSNTISSNNQTQIWWWVQITHTYISNSNLKWKVKSFNSSIDSK